MLRIAIIGVGWAGTRHIQAIQELGRKVRVDCLVDNDADFLGAKAEEFGVQKTYTNFQAALTDPGIDAVSICTPHTLHCPMALAAAEAKKHILCEKPISLTVAEATQMIEAAEKHGVKLYVAENEPYTAMAKCLREIAQTGKYIGELTFASMVKGFRAQEYGYPGRRAWLALPELGGTGTWMLHGIHSIAHLRYIFGDVETVYLQQHRASSFARTDLEGTVSGLLTLKRGAHVSVVQTCETRLSHNLGGFIIHGDQGSIRASRDGYQIFNDDHQNPSLIPYPAEVLSAYAQEMEAFADYVTGVAVGPTTGESERRSLAVVQAGYESVQSGQPVNLQERFGAL